MTNLDGLISKCKGSVSITFNEHTTNYQTIREYLEQDYCNLFEDLDSDLKEEIIAKNIIVEVHFYPETPVGFYLVVHHDLETAIELALKCIND